MSDVLPSPVEVPASAEERALMAEMRMACEEQNRAQGRVNDLLVQIRDLQRIRLRRMTETASGTSRRAVPEERDEMSRREFWIVWSPQGTSPPRVRFEGENGRANAVKAAEDLARRVPGHEFYVMRAEALSIKRDVLTVSLDSIEQEIPF